MTRATRRGLGPLAALAVLAVVAMCAVACGGGPAKPDATTRPPPATSDQGVPALVAGPASRYGAISVSRSRRRAEVPPNLAAGLVPMLIARDLGTPADLSQYGLDAPQATLTFTPTAGGPAALVRIGEPDFDRRGLYAMRDGDSRVFVVLSGGVTPVLALVGIIIAPPSD